MGSNNAKNTSPSFVQKEDKVNTLTATKNDKTRTSLQSVKGNTEQHCFTKIFEQNAVLRLSPKNEKTKNDTRTSSLSSKSGPSSPAVKNNGLNDFKSPSPACQMRKKKNPFVNGYKRNAPVNSNEAIVVEDDDDLIPPTPSPVGQHSFISCHTQSSPFLANERTVSKVHNHLSAANYYKAEQGKRETGKIKSTVLSGSNLTEADDDKELLVSDSPLCKSSETQSTTHTTSRKKYKLSRKGIKPPKVLSSPLKGCNISASVRKSPETQKYITKGTETVDQKESTPIIAPSKCVVLRSRMKRSAAKGSSPLHKKLQTELPLPVKVIISKMLNSATTTKP